MILAVDNEQVNPENIHDNLLGADVPGSTVMLTVQKTNTDVVITVGLIRMPTAEIAGSVSLVCAHVLPDKKNPCIILRRMLLVESSYGRRPR